MITSGSTSGMYISAENAKRPRKRPIRVSATAASVPRIVAAVAETSAMRRLVHAASSTALLLSNSRYQRVEKPPQTATERELLKEKMTRITIGR